MVGHCIYRHAAQPDATGATAVKVLVGVGVFRETGLLAFVYSQPRARERSAADGCACIHHTHFILFSPRIVALGRPQRQ